MRNFEGARAQSKELLRRGTERAFVDTSNRWREVRATGGLVGGMFYLGTGVVLLGTSAFLVPNVISTGNVPLALLTTWLAMAGASYTVHGLDEIFQDTKNKNNKKKP